LGEPGREGGSGSPTTPAPPVVVPADSTGLQLEIARRLIGVMGTQMSVEAEPGRPPHTWFDLSLEKQEEAPSEGVAPPPRANLAGQRLLVVDPTEAIRHALAAKLAQWGCRVDEAGQAEDAMAAAACKRTIVHSSSSTGSPARGRSRSAPPARPAGR
jgi:hypothetical protein